MELNDKLQNAYTMLYHLTGIPFVILRRGGVVAATFPEHLEEYYNTEFWGNDPGQPKDRGHHPNGASIFEIGSYCYVGLTKLDDELIFCTVPIRSNAQVEHNFLPSLLQGFAQDRLVEFYHFLLDVPVRTNFQLAELCSLAKQIYCGEPTDGVNLRHFFPEDERRRISERDAIEFHALKENLDHHRSIDSESALMEAITAGDLAALQSVFHRPMHGEIGKMSLNAVRQAKYEFICMMYAASRAAVAGGISAESSFDLSDYFCQRMDALTDAKSISAYLAQCLEAYCKRVAENRHERAYSAYTKSAQTYIEKHLYEPMDVDAVCAAVGLNKRSLGDYLKRDTGFSIAAYILDKRLSEAAYLLKNSDMELSSISELLQFSSQSHFTKRFKDKYGLAPLQYRLH